MVKDVSYNPPTRRWPMKITFWLVNVAALNAWVVYQKQRRMASSHSGNRRDFLRNLSQQLRRSQMESRAPSWLLAEKQKIEEMKYKLQLKAMGAEKSQLYWCETNQHSVKKDAILRCEKCGKKTCEKHSTLKRFCDACKQSLSPEHKRPREGHTPDKHVTRQQPAVAVSGRCQACQKCTKVIFCSICSKGVCVHHQAQKSPVVCVDCSHKL